MADSLWQDVQAPRLPPSRTLWLVTTVDLTGILLAFFVLVFSTRTLDRDAWHAANGSFRAAFAAQEAVVPMVPDSVGNALVVTPQVSSGLGYLDTLLHQRLRGDAVWGDLVLEDRLDIQAQDMRYALPAAARGDSVEAVEAWRRLAAVVRRWKNPVAVRVVAPSADGLRDAAAEAIRYAGFLTRDGVPGVAAEVTVGPQAGAELVVRVQ